MFDLHDNSVQNRFDSRKSKPNKIVWVKVLFNNDVFRFFFGKINILTKNAVIENSSFIYVTAACFRATLAFSLHILCAPVIVECDFLALRKKDGKIRLMSYKS